MEWMRLGTMAGVIALTAHCGFGVVDTLPPPPAQCTARADPFADFTAYGYAFATDGGPPSAVVYFNSYEAIGFRVDAVRVTAGGTLISVEDLSHDGLDGHRLVTIAPDGSGSPITLEVDLGCGAATTTKHYSMSVSGIGAFAVTEG